MSLTDSEKNKLKRYKLSGLNKPKRTPQHPTIKFFGLDPVVLKKDHLNLRSMFVV